MTTFEIKLPLFEGPFDLLLFFIERDELDIYDIPIAKITVDFLAYLQQVEKMNIELASEFILVAASLMRIKAKMLLPRPIQNEAGQEIDPRAELVNHLLEYKKYKLVAQQLLDLETERLNREIRGNVAQEIQQLALKADSEAEMQDLDLYKLLKVYTKVINRFKNAQNKPVHQILPYAYTIEQQRKVIMDLVAQHQEISFVAIIQQGTGGKIEAIFNFLAILDLLQSGHLSLRMGEGMNDFWIAQKLIEPN